jgi:hypothetical protein
MATFQLILVTTDQRKSFVIFNYIHVNWTAENSRNVFIGYSNGRNALFTNPFSSLGGSAGNPQIIDDVTGNTGRTCFYCNLLK